MRRFSVILMLSLLLFSGCNIEQNQNQNIIGYEYLSKDAVIPDEVNQWLIGAETSKDEIIHSLGSEEGIMYVYAKGHKKAKVSYINENIEGKQYQNLKVTLLKGNSNDTVFVKISYDSDLCCDTEILDATENEDEFYAERR
ncbi:hypothetical protein [Bacillus sp. CHD6a]|uniref:hypothetical protein n=1 Tax=Bacillus sp. CHD6a TaxID=1643452 RepID=UPI000761448F|nr:hypothetical protein [Bacillus sp. CHD6a]